MFYSSSLCQDLDPLQGFTMCTRIACGLGQCFPAPESWGGGPTPHPQHTHTHPLSPFFPNPLTPSMMLVYVPPYHSLAWEPSERKDYIPVTPMMPHTQHTVGAQ